ncbi:MAG: energy transducer TonB [Rhodocyclaceae bacterium]|nr:MAG: energy transducer TonB [Rhodocyclaceae bacterium]
MAPFEPLAFQTSLALSVATRAPGRWRGKLPWVVAATLLHAALLTSLVLMPTEQPVQAPTPLAVDLLSPPSQEKTNTPKPQPRIEKRQAPPVPIAKTPTPTALSTQAQPTPPAVEALPTKASNTPAQATPQPVVQAQFDAAYLNNPKPDYPRMSKRLGETGKVFLRVHVLADGNPDQVELRTSSGFTRLDNAAQEAVKHWRFVPAKQGSEAIAAWVVVPITFSLEN